MEEGDSWRVLRCVSAACTITAARVLGLLPPRQQRAGLTALSSDSTQPHRHPGVKTDRNLSNQLTHTGNEVKVRTCSLLYSFSETTASSLV